MEVKGKLTSIMGSYMKASSIHGVSHIANSGSTTRKAIWCTLVAAALVAVTYQIHLQVHQYLQYHSHITINIQHEQQVQFPAVTLCNINPLRKVRVFAAMEKIYASRILNNTEYVHKCAHVSRMYQEDEELIYIANTTQKRSDCLFPPYNMDMRHMIDLTALHSDIHRVVSIFHSNVSEGYLRDYGYPIQDMLISCRWLGKSCNESDFLWYPHPKYINCYTFVPGNSFVNPSTVKPDYGLHLELFVDQIDYINYYSKRAGIRVSIGDTGEYPFPDKTGFDIAPGLQTTVAVAQYGYKRLPEPWVTGCQDNLRLEDGIKLKSMSNESWSYLRKYGVGYSVALCRETCQMAAKVERCQCWPPDIYSYHWSASEARVCSEHECVDPLVNTNCPCPLKCDDKMYEVRSLTTSQWPLRDNTNYFLYTSFLPALRRSHPHYPLEQLAGYSRSNEVYQLISDNVAKLVVHLEGMSVVQVIYQRADTASELLSGLGGSLGLFLGLSLVALFELLELAYDIIRAACVTTGSGRRKKRAQVSASRRIV